MSARHSVGLRWFAGCVSAQERCEMVQQHHTRIVLASLVVLPVPVSTALPFANYIVCVLGTPRSFAFFQRRSCVPGVA